MDSDRQTAVQTGIISAMPLTPHSILIIDTTPNGIDDSYYPLVMEAIEDNPKWTKRLENWKGELTAEQVLDGVLGVPDAVEKGYPGVMVPAICPWRLHEEYTCRSKSNPRGELFAAYEGPARRDREQHRRPGAIRRRRRGRDARSVRRLDGAPLLAPTENRRLQAPVGRGQAPHVPARISLDD